ncbi:basic proline-rich protein-like [Dama dama]|uniref:basic proline-rich protein-like n=1 Tax=Dama dama TaxID=30532 RepID=UPI002A35C03A|nr:basic proline-rich protein-like [Dama dama]
MAVAIQKLARCYPPCPLTGWPAGQRPCWLEDRLRLEGVRVISVFIPMVAGALALADEPAPAGLSHLAWPHPWRGLHRKPPPTPTPGPSHPTALTAVGRLPSSRRPSQAAAASHLLDPRGPSPSPDDLPVSVWGSLGKPQRANFWIATAIAPLREDDRGPDSQRRPGLPPRGRRATPHSDCKKQDDRPVAGALALADEPAPAGLSHLAWPHPWRGLHRKPPPTPTPGPSHPTALTAVGRLPSSRRPSQAAAASHLLDPRGPSPSPDDLPVSVWGSLGKPQRANFWIATAIAPLREDDRGPDSQRRPGLPPRGRRATPHSDCKKQDDRPVAGALALADEPAPAGLSHLAWPHPWRGLHRKPPPTPTPGPSHPTALTAVGRLPSSRRPSQAAAASHLLDPRGPSPSPDDLPVSVWGSLGKPQRANFWIATAIAPLREDDRGPDSQRRPGLPPRGRRATPHSDCKKQDDRPVAGALALADEPAPAGLSHLAWPHPWRGLHRKPPPTPTPGPSHPTALTAVGRLPSSRRPSQAAAASHLLDPRGPSPSPDDLPVSVWGSLGKPQRANFWIATAIAPLREDDRGPDSQRRPGLPPRGRRATPHSDCKKQDDRPVAGALALADEPAPAGLSHLAWPHPWRGLHRKPPPTPTPGPSHPTALTAVGRLPSSRRPSQAAAASHLLDPRGPSPSPDDLPVSVWGSLGKPQRANFWIATAIAPLREDDRGPDSQRRPGLPPRGRRATPHSDCKKQDDRPVAGALALADEPAPAGLSHLAWPHPWRGLHRKPPPTPTPGPSHPTALTAVGRLPSSRRPSQAAAASHLLDPRGPSPSPANRAFGQPASQSAGMAGSSVPTFGSPRP